MLSHARIAALAAREGVDRLTVENFLGTLGGLTQAEALANLELDAVAYGWSTSHGPRHPAGHHGGFVAERQPEVRGDVLLPNTPWLSTAIDDSFVARVPGHGADGNHVAIDQIAERVLWMLLPELSDARQNVGAMGRTTIEQARGRGRVHAGHE